jgi:hypothetical protein
MHKAPFDMHERSGRIGRVLFVSYVAFCVSTCALAAAQQPLDRVLARIGSNAVTQTDVRAAIGLGLIEATTEGADALNQTIDRQLMLSEVARFPPPEPSPAAIDQQVVAMKMRAGANLSALMRDTGLDDARLRDLARDTLRIQTYVSQRFGTSRQVSDDDVRHYYDEHPAEFTRNGQKIPFADAEASARQLASAARLRESIAQWVRDLRMRSEVVEVGKK